MALRPSQDIVDRGMDTFTALLTALAGQTPVQVREVSPGFILAPLNYRQSFRDIVLEEYPKVYVDDLTYPTPFFVDDTPEAVVDRLKDTLAEINAHYLVTITPIRKEDQEASGGWRWHKWGTYLGTQNPQCEYLYDEPEIESVVLAHVYQVKPRD